LFYCGVINNVDIVLLMSLTVTCNQQARPAVYVVLRPSSGSPHYMLISVCPSVLHLFLILYH